MRELGESWLTHNMVEKGLFRYSLNPWTGEVSTKNNELRQLMASRLLAGMSTENGALRPLHRRNMKFVLSHWFKSDGELAYIRYQGKSKLGANAMLLRTLVASDRSGTYRAEARLVADGIRALQQPSGAFRAWLIEPAYEYDEEYLLTFYSGEAILALLELYLLTAEEEYLAIALRSANHYIARYCDQIGEHFYPAYVPWHSMAYNSLFKITRDARFARAVFTMSDKLLELQDPSTGRFYDPERPQYGTPHASSDGVYAEGLAHALDIALSVRDPVRARRYETAICLAIGHLESLQLSEALPGSDMPLMRYKGGVLTTRKKNSWIRVDNVQHLVDALRYIENVLQPRLASAGMEAADAAPFDGPAWPEFAGSQPARDPLPLPPAAWNLAREVPV